MDSNGQLSLEYMQLFLISLIILATISIPLVYDSIDNINDIKKVTQTKNTLTEIANTANIIYACDYGTKKTVPVRIYNKMTVYYEKSYNKHYIYSYITLSDNTRKKIKSQVPCKVSFSNKPAYYYSSLNERWYYNTEVKWINSSQNEYNIDIYFK